MTLPGVAGVIRILAPAHQNIGRCRRRNVFAEKRDRRRQRQGFRQSEIVYGDDQRHLERGFSVDDDTCLAAVFAGRLIFRHRETQPEGLRRAAADRHRVQKRQQYVRPETEIRRTGRRRLLRFHVTDRYDGDAVRPIVPAVRQRRYRHRYSGQIAAGRQNDQLRRFAFVAGCRQPQWPGHRLEVRRLRQYFFH